MCSYGGQGSSDGGPAGNAGNHGNGGGGTGGCGPGGINGGRGGHRGHRVDGSSESSGAGSGGTGNPGNDSGLAIRDGSENRRRRPRQRLCRDPGGGDTGEQSIEASTHWRLERHSASTPPGRGRKAIFLRRIPLPPTFWPAALASERLEVRRPYSREYARSNPAG